MTEKYDVALSFAGADRPIAKKITDSLLRKGFRVFFDEYSEDDFARSGFQATENFDIAQGPLENFEPNQINNLRLIGLPVQLSKGVVKLENDLTVCETGEVLTPEKAKILELMGKRMAQFRLRLRCHYQKDGNAFEQLIEVEGNDPIEEE